MNKASLTTLGETPPTAKAQAVAEVLKNERLDAEVEMYPLARRLSPAPDGEELAEPTTGFWRRHRLFIVSVILPVLIGAGLLLFIPAPRYSSSTNFIVRSTGQNSAQTAAQSLAVTAAAPTINDETSAVNVYLTSRDIVDLLAKNDNLRNILSRSQGDFIFRYPTFWLPDNEEFLYRRFQWMATASIDRVSGVNTLEVNAFTPEDAQSLARAMLSYAETLVNRMNERLYQSQVSIVNHFVSEAQEDADAIEAELKGFRIASGSVDPNLVADSELDVIQGLTTQLAQVEASIKRELMLTSASPALAALHAKAQSYRDEIEKRNLEIAGASGSEAAKLRTYDQLMLRRDLANNVLADAEAQRANAREDAARQHLFIQIISQPKLEPDWARYPRVTLNLLALIAICLMVFQVLRKLRDFAWEHHL